MNHFVWLVPSNHRKCFICNTNKNKIKLHTINQNSIDYALIQHKILLKKCSRCCRHHLNEDGGIRNDQYDLIRSKSIKYFGYNNKIISDTLTTKSRIFDRFKDIDNIEDSFCKKITGWSKLQFIRFTKYITSLNDSGGRTIDELVAIYRYWLMKGIDQTTLAYSKTNTNQQQISHYLSQIRKALTNDFVPYFLGASKGREFFIAHNNISVRTLYELGNNDLVLIADGTYLRCEKSHNNQFQYLSYSGQKKCQLIKPFIICCSDGYIVDVYGPYGGKFNDSSILDHIMKNDVDLKSLMKPFSSTYLFLDRGFNFIHLSKINY